MDSLQSASLISVALEVGFRSTSAPIYPPKDLDPIFHHDWVFEAAFSSHADEVIADAVCIWVAGPRALPISCMRYFAKRMEEDTPFSPRLRQVSIWAIERRIQDWGLWGSELELIPLLDRLEVVVDDMEDRGMWGSRLVDVVRFSVGRDRLSTHYWSLLGKLVMLEGFYSFFGPDDMEVMTSLGEAREWEKLEVLLAVAWRGRVQGIEQVTLKLLSQQLSTLPRFENLCDVIRVKGRAEELRQICRQARTTQPPPESPPPYVPVRPTQHLSILMPSFFLVQPNRLMLSQPWNEYAPLYRFLLSAVSRVSPSSRNPRHCLIFNPFIIHRHSRVKIYTTCKE